jgi:hypothetical protein
MAGISNLFYLVKDAVQTIDWSHQPGRFQLSDRQSFPAENLMILQVYCYARGVYSSEDVEDVVRQDPAMKELFPEAWPERTTIRKFRRQHRAAIQACLLRIFSQALALRFGDPASGAAPIDHCVALALDKWFEPMCGPQPEKEAEQRIEKASFWDGMAATD